MAIFSFMLPSSALGQGPSAGPCADLLASQQPMARELTQLLGPWTRCKQTGSQTEYGTYAAFAAQWPNVMLTVKYMPPETGIYVIETTGPSPLSSDWYESRKTHLVDDAFDMNWDMDEFPGPTSEYYIGQDSGSNAQFWAERDKDSAVTWMRFSYAL